MLTFCMDWREGERRKGRGGEKGLTGERGRETYIKEGGEDEETKGKTVSEDNFAEKHDARSRGGSRSLPCALRAGGIRVGLGTDF